MPHRRSAEFSDEQWGELIRTGLEFLQDQASLGEAVDVISYTDFNKRLDTEHAQGVFKLRLQVARNDLSYLLEDIAECDIEARGMKDDPKFLLTSLVTFMHDKSHPGDGFFKLAQRKGLLKPEQDKLEFWVLQVKAARDYYTEARSRAIRADQPR
jgi:hypothetical protein